MWKLPRWKRQRTRLEKWRKIFERLKFLPQFPLRTNRRLKWELWTLKCCKNRAMSSRIKFRPWKSICNQWRDQSPLHIKVDYKISAQDYQEIFSEILDVETFDEGQNCAWNEWSVEQGGRVLEDSLNLRVWQTSIKSSKSRLPAWKLHWINCKLACNIEENTEKWK